MNQHMLNHIAPQSDAFDFFELADIPAALFDTNLQLLRANQPFSRQYRYVEGEIYGSPPPHECPHHLGKSCSTLGCSSLLLRPYLASLSTDTPQLSVQVELCVGVQQQLRFSLGPNHTLLLTLRDLEKKSDEALKLEQLSESLQWANNDLSEFSYAVTHDLRSPVRALRTIPEWVDTDLREAIGHVPESVTHHLDLMQQQAIRLESMLDNLLTYTQVGRFDDPSQPISLLQTLNQLRHELVLPQGFELELPERDHLLQVPETELRIALKNLVDNAIRHHHQSSGRVVVETCSPNNHLLICVIDDGPGIPHQYHQTALKIFSTLNSRDVREGSGMGLPITQKIIRNWGGKLSINEGLEDRGTRITLAIPAERYVA